MTSWLLPTASVVGFFVAVWVLRASDAVQLRRELVQFELRFPTGLDEAAVASFLGSITGLLPPWWRRWFHQPFIAIEIDADHRGVRHRLLVPRRFVRSVTASLAAHLPGVSYEQTDTVRPFPQRGAEYRLTNAERSLDVEPEAISARLLASLQPLGKDERIVVQFLVAPARPVAPARLATADERERELRLDDGVMVTSEAVSALRKKRSRPLLLACLRIAATAPAPRREVTLLRGVEASWHATRAPGVMLKRRHLPGRTVADRIRSVWVPLNRWPALLNVDELAGIVGAPTGSSSLPGIDLAACPPMIVPTVVSRFGTVLGDGTHPRSRRPVAIDARARLHHGLIVGPTGSGKSVLATHLAVADAAAGHGLIVVDPKDGGLIDAIAGALPEDRLDDVIVVDPTESTVVGFDPLASTPATRELVVDRVLGLMTSIWGRDLVGPRSADIIRHVLLTIAASETLRLTEAPRLIADASFRRRVLKATTLGFEVRAWWEWVDGLSAGEWVAMTAPVLNKLRAFVGRTPVANTLGQNAPALDFARVLRERQIVLVRLPVGLLGDETTGLIGALLINQLWNAVAARAGISAERRRPVSVIIDEVGTVLRFPGSSIETMLTQARGYSVGVTLAAQHLSQLPTDVCTAALTNARTKVVFPCGRDDAGVFARELGNGLRPEHLMGIDAFHAIAAVYADGKTQAPATIRTRPPADPLRDAEVVREASRRRWGVDRESVAEQRRARVETHPEAEAKPVGRRRRKP